MTLFDGKRNPVKEKGIVPFTVDIPLSETAGSDVPGDHYLAFTVGPRTGSSRTTRPGRPPRASVAAATVFVSGRTATPEESA